MFNIIQVLHKPLELNMVYLPKGTACILVPGLHHRFHLFYRRTRVGSIDGKTYHQYFVR